MSGQKSWERPLTRFSYTRTEEHQTKLTTKFQNKQKKSFFTQCLVKVVEFLPARCCGGLKGT